MSSPSSPRPTGAAGALYRWYVVSLLGLIYFVAFADRLALGLLIEPIKHELRVSDTQVGLLFGLSFAATLALVSIPFGRLADRGNRRDLIAVAVWVWSLMTALSGLARGFGALLFCRVGLAVGEAGLTPAALSMIADLFPARARGVPISVYLTAGVAGASGSFIILGAVIHAVSSLGPVQAPVFGLLAPWRLTLIAIGLPTTAVALLLRLTVREPARESDRRTQGSALEALTYLRDRARENLGFFAAGALLALMGISSTAWFPTFLIRERHIPAPQVGYLLGSVSIIAAVSGSLLVPTLAQALAARRAGGLKTAAMVAVAVGAPCFALGPQMTSLPLSLGLMATASFCFVGGINIPAVAIQQSSPNHLRGQLAALYFVGVNLGGLGVGPVLTAVIAKLAFGGDHGLGPALSSLAVIAGPLAFLALLGLPRAPATAADGAGTAPRGQAV